METLEIRSNPIRTRADWERMRAEAAADTGRFHGEIARQEIHWYDAALGAWILYDGQGWSGFDAQTGQPVSPAYGPEHQPWDRAFDDDEPPFYRWFTGGLTNAGFNEVDRHVLAGHGQEVAFHFEGDRWDAAADRPVVQQAISRRQLLWEVARAARVLRRLGLQKGDRIALNLPNIMEQIYYTEAAKRLGVIYTPVFGGFSDKTLSDRIANAGAEVVITADGAYRNAQVVPFKESFTDPALDRYLPVESALALVRERLAGSPALEPVLARMAAALEGEITASRADLMRAVGQGLALADGLSPGAKAAIRTAIAQALADAPPRVRVVVVVRHTRQEIVWRPERDRWHHDLANEAEAEILAEAGLSSPGELFTLDDQAFVAHLWRAEPPLPVDAEWPLFIIYTSGSTGKPKGVVHVHGGYTVGVAHTLKAAFDARPGEDCLYVVADPGWITGQSYMISAALTGRITSVIAEGSPLVPHAGRFAATIQRCGVTIFKAGVTFLKAVMADPQSQADVAQYRLGSLRVATFCAEPVSPAVQAFGMAQITPRYINSYWATEHGGIVWTHFFGCDQFALQPDAHTYPLPWVFGQVCRPDGTPAADEEKGELVIERPYPYLARTIWGDPANLCQPGWKGDGERYAATYWSRFPGRLVYVQGDFAMRYADGSFTLHGRSDDVINVSGHRMGTEEIEGAILRDRQVNPDSPVGNVLVVGAPHREKGLTPLAFIQPVPGRRLTEDDRRRLADLVRQEKGAVAVPSDFITVSGFPETRSGKYLRRFVARLCEGADLGDTSALRNPEVLTELRQKIAAWQERQEEEQGLFEFHRFFRLQVMEGVALLTLANPPVNALNERALDELNTIVDHLERRPDVKAIVIAGDGATFAAGADVKQLVEEMHQVEEALPLARKAHRAFAKLERMEKPVVAAIAGVALGGGCELAMACHYRIAEPDARLGLPEIGLNLLPGYGGTQRLPRLIGPQRAVALILGGRSITAQVASDWGLVDEVADQQDALSRALALATRYARDPGGPLAVAQMEREEALLHWAEPGAFPPVEADRYLAQADRAGRRAAAERALAAMRYGYEQGFAAGLEREAELFAQAVVDPDGGRRGIQAFLDKASPPLPTRDRPALDEAALLARGHLLPVGAPFFPGFTRLPLYQYAQAVVRCHESGQPLHGDPVEAERQVLVPVEQPGPNEALVYVLASEVNFNDIWAITGIPVSPFDSHDEDLHITGSGGVGLIAAMGSELRRQGRWQVGDLVTLYSGQSDLLAPEAGGEPMQVGFSIQGYEGPKGSHQQFVRVQGPQLHRKPADLTLEAAGSYILNLGTIYRALFTTLQVAPGRSVYVEGAATGTGLEAVKVAARHGLRTVGLVSSAERAQAVRTVGGAGAIDRRSPGLAAIWRKVPADPAQWGSWEAEGEPLLAAYRAESGGPLADYAVSHAGETAFPRAFQLLADGGTLTFFGASSGYHFTFMGKPGEVEPAAMLARAGLRPGEAVLLYYGVAGPALVDEAGLAALEAAREAGARVVVATRSEAQREFVESLGWGDAVRGCLSIEEIRRRWGQRFNWPETMPDLPNPRTQTEAFRQAVYHYTERVFKPFGAAVGALLRSADNPRGYPDLIIERAGHDALGISTMLVKPHTGRVVYCESMAGRRYSFYAPQVWMRQRRIYLPTANIWGTHLCNAHEVVRLNQLVEAGHLEVTEPLLVDWEELPQAHQAMWENRHQAASYVVNHALPRPGLRGRDELLQAWARQQQI